MTQLLVSVRSPVEAIAAVAGGADIVDVKEPLHGPLGCASPEVILEICSALRSLGVQPPLSLALGELCEWNSVPRDDLYRTIETASPRFLKIGLAGTESRRIQYGTVGAATTACSAGTSWFREWQHLQAAIGGLSAWVAVAYADAELAGSPAIDDVLSGAISAGCSVLLIDTHTKDAGSLVSHLSITELMAIRDRTSRHGMKLALAGQVTLANLAHVVRIQPDIVAVRGAVCDGGKRTSTVSTKLVQQFREALV